MNIILVVFSKRPTLARPSEGWQTLDKKAVVGSQCHLLVKQGRLLKIIRTDIGINI